MWSTMHGNVNPCLMKGLGQMGIFGDKPRCGGIDMVATCRPREVRCPTNPIEKKGCQTQWYHQCTRLVIYLGHHLAEMLDERNVGQGIHIDIANGAWIIPQIKALAHSGT